MKNLNQFDELDDNIEDVDDWTDYDFVEVTEEEKNFAKDIFNMLQDEINQHSINEAFTGKQSANKHFTNHCLGNSNYKKSKRSHVYYDFKNVSEYIEYEKILNAVIHTPDTTIASLLDTELVLKAFSKLFEGNYSILFSIPCGLHNEQGDVMLALQSFASNVTTNYLENTVNFMILTPRFKTVTLYPVSASYVKNKFNNIVKKNISIDTEFNV